MSAQSKTPAGLLRQGAALGFVRLLALKLAMKLAVMLTMTCLAVTAQAQDEQTPAAPPAITVTPAVGTPSSTASTAEVDASPQGPGLEPRPLPSAPVDLWQRVRQGFAMPDVDTALVRKWEQFYATRPDYVLRITERGGRYLFHIVEEIQRRDMPLDLALLPFIESAFNPQAQSSARASGMWQFMPGTGKDFDLRQNVFRDDRRDVLASTRAALDYLQMLYKRFGDWHLALAAYNWGQGNVQRALNRNAKARLPTDYLSLTMPDETRNYVPKLQAIKNIVLRPESFALNVPTLANESFFVSIPVDTDIDAALVARLSGLTIDEFQQLNPQLNKPVILAAGTPQVLLPHENAERFQRGLASHLGPRASWTAWVAPRTLKPADAAKLVGMSEASLREVNRIPQRMLVTVGSTLLVPRSADATANVTEHIAENGKMDLSPEARAQRQLNFRAGKHGDSVAAVAKRYGLRPELVARLNGVAATARFAPGQVVKLVLPTASATNGKAKTASAKTGKAAASGKAKKPNQAKPHIKAKAGTTKTTR